MKNFILAAILLLSGITAFGQDAEFSSTRLNNLASDLKHLTVDLSDRTYEDLKRGSSNTRREVEAAFLAQQFDASAGLFQQMVRDNRRASELRDAALLLNEIARKAPGFGSHTRLWQDAKNAVDNIERELGGRGTGNEPPPRSGIAFWRGTVDNKVQLIIKGTSIETRTVAGRAYPAGTYSFTATLPGRNVTVDVLKKEGRGKVRILQQPDRSNDFTAIIEIYDDGGGAKQYQLEISW